MPTITITITVPEGVAVDLGGQRAAPSADPMTSARIAPRGSAVCPEHNEPWKHVPPGVSKKTGKSYTAFWACPEMGCNARPAIGWKPPGLPVQDIAPGDDLDSDEVPFF